MGMLSRTNSAVRKSALLFAIAFLPAACFAQPAQTPPAFEISDVHVSPPSRYDGFEDAFLLDGRYTLRQATMADLIKTAYGLKETSYIHGGPSWLEWDRWDVIGKVPPNTSEATAKLMLQSLLAQRFGLVVHTGNAPMPAYVLTAPKGKDKLKESDSTGAPGCKFHPPDNSAPNAIPQLLFNCHNETMQQFADDVHMLEPFDLTDPVVDATGLKGAYDFDLTWTPHQAFPNAGADGITIFVAVDRQLGLKLTHETAPRPVLMVDTVNETATPNSPDLVKLMPQLPPAQFEVATIKPPAPDERRFGRIEGNEVDVRNFPLKQLIYLAWNLDQNNKGEIVGAPKWLDTAMIDIQAKVASSNISKNGNATRQSIPFPDLQEMIKALLIERYEMKVHMEDQLVDDFDLITVKSKLTPADPRSRTSCREGVPGPDGVDPRIAHPIQNMLASCQNVTMAQIVEQFPQFAPCFLYHTPADKTGLTGGWNFTLNWSSCDKIPGFQAGQDSSQPQGAESASDPNGALSFYDAVSRQLGLKLVKVKRAEPVLVIDKMDEQPLPN